MGTGVRSLGRTDVYGFAWGLGFEAGIRCSRFAARCLEVAIRGWERSLERAEVYGFGWGLRFERRYVACRLRFGPESGLGFRV